MSTSNAGTTTQVFRIYVRATPEAIWDAITSTEMTAAYGYRAPVEYDLRPGGAYRCVATDEMKAFGAPDVMIDGEVVEVDPPHRLVQTWRGLFGPETIAEGARTLTWELEWDETGGFTRLTLSHDVTDAPITAAMVSGADPRAGGGWSWVLSSLKSLLETGQAL